MHLCGMITTEDSRAMFLSSIYDKFHELLPNIKRDPRPKNKSEKNGIKLIFPKIKICSNIYVYVQIE